jgi:hypothetical protein
MKQNMTYNSESVLCFRAVFFYVIYLYFDTTLPALSKISETVVVEFFRLFLKTFSLHAWNSSHVKWISLICYLELQPTRRHMGPKPGSREGVEQLVFRCNVSPLTWQHWYWVWRHHVEEIPALFPRRTRVILEICSLLGYYAAYSSNSFPTLPRRL